ncbi:MAG: TenA family protein [Candidatus Aminicenantes bacterium]|nr:TenA family protein [Candidatus Aminicenantes bacterium]
MNTADKLRKDAEAVWKKIVGHPFVVELYTGDLPIEKFTFYILQDYHYLIAAMKNFGLMASKASSVEAMREVIDILHLEATSEFDGYEELLNRLGYSIQDASEIEPLPSTISYSSFLLSISSLESYAEAITSVLPCFWSYAEIAEYHKDRLSTNPNQLYKDWAMVYTADPYLKLVEKMKKLVNEAGKGFSYKKLYSVFIKASRYEYMFWDSVYHKTNWPDEAKKL